jgi:hypothetical protein
MNIRKFQIARLSHTNPIRSRIPSILSYAIPHVEKNLYVVLQKPNFQLLPPSSKRSFDSAQKQHIPPMSHVIYKQLTATKILSIYIILHNVDSQIKLTNLFRISAIYEAVFLDCLSSPGLYNYFHDHFNQLDQNFELRSIDKKGAKENRSINNLPALNNDLFNNKSPRQYYQGVLDGKAKDVVKIKLIVLGFRYIWYNV